MKAFEWIDRVKKHCGIDSDYAAAKLLGIGKQTISTYRAKGSTLDEHASISVAHVLGISPAGVVLDQAAERTKTPEVRATLLAEARRLCILCLMKDTYQFAIGLIAPKSAGKDVHLLTTQRRHDVRIGR